jgi:hypothetical protein
MTDKLKGVLPLAAVIGVLAFIYVEFTLNFTFQWFTDGDLGNGISLPANFHLIAPVGFISWGFYFAAGTGTDGVIKVSASSVIGSVGALLVMILAPELADFPDFWGISLMVAITAFLLVMTIPAGDWYYVPSAFGAYAAVVLWWFATGLDNWADSSGIIGGGVGNSPEALGDPTTAGYGAVLGILSTPYVWVWINVLVTLFIGVLMGWLSTTITGAITPAPDEEAPAEAADETAAE